MSFLSLWSLSGILILVLMVLLWLLNLRLKNASIVDIFWGLGFIIVFWITTWLNLDSFSNRTILLGTLVSI